MFAAVSTLWKVLVATNMAILANPAPFAGFRMTLPRWTATWACHHGRFNKCSECRVLATVLGLLRVEQMVESTVNLCLEGLSSNTSIVVLTPWWLRLVVTVGAKVLWLAPEKEQRTLE